MRDNKECGMYKPMRYYSKFKGKSVELTKEEFKTMSYNKWMYPEVEDGLRGGSQ